MRARSLLVGLLIGLCRAGCSLVENGACILPYRVRESLDDCAEGRRNRCWAEQAWKQVRAGEGGERYSADYGDGFKDGFADYLFAGGDCEPPPLPPNKYRALCYQTPQGYQAVEDWFTGYRHGATVARDGGYREWVTGPSSLRLAAQLQAPPPAPAPVVEPLPPPQPTPPKEEKQGASPPPADAPIAVDYREPTPRSPPPPRTVKQSPTAPAPAVPTDVRARFHQELNQWEVVWNSPQGGVHTKVMSPAPFTELIKRIMHDNSDDQAAAAGHGLTIVNGAKTTAVEIDDEAFDSLAAYLEWYYEDPGQ